jgi:galactose-1-phosphate uridylyltransferase
MQATSLDDIRQKAHEFNDQNLQWHFHILTPTCKFNKSKKFAFVLEGASESYAYYSDRAEKELGRELVPLLHGSGILMEESGSGNYKPSETISKIVQLAKDLNKRGEQWHHHVLFPGCRYNKNSQEFTFIFEGGGKVFENITTEEPKDDIKLIEPLFFQAT